MSYPTWAFHFWVSPGLQTSLLNRAITPLSVTRLALPNVVALADELALGLGLALAEALGEAEPLAVALAEAPGDGLEVAAGTILAEVFAVLVELALGLALADPLALALAEALADWHWHWPTGWPRASSCWSPRRARRAAPGGTSAGRCC